MPSDGVGGNEHDGEASGGEAVVAEDGTAAAIATVALARSRGGTVRRLGALYAAQSHVIERIEALPHPGSDQRRLSTSWATALVGIAVLALAVGCRSTEGFFEHVVR